MSSALHLQLVYFLYVNTCLKETQIILCHQTRRVWCLVHRKIVMLSWYWQHVSYGGVQITDVTELNWCCQATVTAYGSCWHARRQWLAALFFFHPIGLVRSSIGIFQNWHNYTNHPRHAHTHSDLLLKTLLSSFSSFSSSP